MSGKATGWVGQFGPMPDDIDRHGQPYKARARGLRFVLLGVADAANVEGRHSHPGTEAVAAFALYSFGQTRRLLDELEAEGWLIVTQRATGPGRAVVYDLSTDSSNPHTQRRAWCAPLFVHNGCAQPAERRASRAPNGAHLDANGARERPNGAHPDARLTVSTVSTTRRRPRGPTVDSRPALPEAPNEQPRDEHAATIARDAIARIRGTA